MKREGRQHGVVRSYPILPTPLSRQRRSVKTVDSSSVAGVFTRVSSKPTNHSKFTGKCGSVGCLGCHVHPVCKSKVKAKGTIKLRSNGRELIGCSSGTSVVDALAHLARNENCDDDYGYDDDDDYDDEFGNEGVLNVREEVIEVEDEDDDDEEEEDDDDDDDDDDGDDGWYLVGRFQ